MCVYQECAIQRGADNAKDADEFSGMSDKADQQCAWVDANTNDTDARRFNSKHASKVARESEGLAGVCKDTVRSDRGLNKQYCISRKKFKSSVSSNKRVPELTKYPWSGLIDKFVFCECGGRCKTFYKSSLFAVVSRLSLIHI